MSDDKLGFDEYWCEYEASSDFINSRKHAVEDVWNHQQTKIDDVLHFIDNMDTVDIENDVVLRNTVYEIKELLK